MSREVDERVVSMQFDNKQFEANVATTMSTLDKLENKLNFKGASKALDELNASAKNVDFSHMGNAVDSIEVKFSAMSIAAIAAINRIVNKAFDAGEQLIKSLSIDQITAGWTKYADKTTAVQTILAATGESMEYVNEQLSKMNWFTDETSFNFTDMTNNVGKFTSAGVDLDKAVLAMQGIAAEAALSGQNAQSASRAMYNFSQALGTGSVRVQDWMSIENANMATKEFKETIIETAKELGRVSEAGEILAITSAQYSGDEFVNFSNFRNTLSAGWFDSDVLIKSLEKYGGFATKLQEITDATGTTATEMLRYVREYESGTTDIGKISRITGVSVEELSGYMETLTSKEYELGRKAFQAAQEAKTFQEAIDATKDAVSTGWMNTFEKIFGNYEEAKVIWTKLAEDFYDIFAAGGEDRNALLDQWNEEFNGRTILIEGLSNAMDRLKDILGLVQDAFSTVFPPMTARQLANITYHFRRVIDSIKIFEEDGETLTGTGQTIYTVFHSIAEVISVFATALGTLGDIAKGVLGAFGDAVKEVFEPLSDDLLTNATTRMKKFIKSLKPGENAFKNLTKIFKLLLTPIKAIVDILGSLGNALLNLIPSSEKVGTAMERAFGEERYKRLTKAFGGVVDNLVSLFEKLVSKITGLFKSNELGEESPFVRALNAIYAIIEPIASWMLDKIIEGLESLAALDWDTILLNLENNLAGVQTKITNIIDSVSGFFADSKDFTNKNLFGLGSISELVDTLTLDMKSLTWNNSIAGVASTLKDDVLGDLGDSFTNIGTKMVDFVSKIDPAKVAVVGFGTALTASLGAATNMMVSAKNVFTGFTGILTQVKANVAAMKPQRYEKIALAILLLAGALVALALVKPEGLKQATTSMLEMIAALTGFVVVLTLIDKFLLKGPADAIKLQGMAASILLLSGAFLILSIALVALSKANPDQLGDKIGALATAMVLLAGVSVILGVFVPQMTSNMIGILAFSAGVLLLVKALNLLGDINFSSIEENIVILIGILMSLAIITRIGGKGSFSGSAGMILTMLSILLLVNVLKKLAETNFGEIERGILPMIGLMVIVSLAAKATSKASKDAAKAGVAALLISAATLILVETIRQLGELPVKQAIQGTIGVVVLLGMLAIVVRQLREISPNATKAAAAVLLLSVATLLLSKTIKMLGSLRIEEALIGVGAVTALLGMFALIIRATKDANKAGGTILAITAAVASIAVAIALLATFDDPDAVIKIAGSISAVMLAFAGMIKLISNDLKLGTALKMAVMLVAFAALFKVVSNALKDLSVEGNENTVIAFTGVIIALTGCVVVLSRFSAAQIKNCTGTLAEMALLALAGVGIVYALSKIEVTNGLVEKAETFALAIAALSGATVALSLVKIDPGTIGSAVLGFTEVVVGIGTIVTVLGGLSKIEGFEELIRDGSRIFALLGEVIGSFVGNVIGGLIGGIVEGFNMATINSMVTISEKLKEFMDTVGQIQSASIDNFKAVMEALLLLTAAKFLNGIGLFTNKVKEWKDLGKGLNVFKKSFIPFLEDISNSEISYSNVKSAVTAMEGIADLVNAIPGGISIKTAWSGVKDLSKFGEELEAFAPHFKAYMEEISQIKVNDEANKAVVAAATTVAEFAKITPKEDGILQAIIGKNIRLDVFGEELEKFAPHFKNYVDTVKTIDVTNIDKYTAPIEALVKITNLVPKDTTDSLIGGIFGKNVNMDDFGYNLAMFGLWFKIYAGHLEELPESVDVVAVTENIVSATTKIIEMAKTLDAEGGFLNGIFGDNSTAFKNFGENLSSYGESIAAFYNTISEIKPDFTDTVQAFRDAGFKMITKFMDGMNSQMTPAKDTALEIVNECLSKFNNIQNEETMRLAGNNFAMSFKNGISEVSDQIKTEATNCASGALNGLKTTLDIREGTNPYSYKTRNIGKQVVKGMQLGIGDGEAALLARINTMGANVIAALKRKLDIRSPSRVARDQVGVFIPQGVAEGIEKDNSDEIAARNKAAKIVDAISGTLTDLENGEDFNPTITPILDLSEIQNGAKSINGIIDTNARLSFGASANLNAISSGFNSIQNPLATPPQNVTNNYGQIITYDQLATAVKEALNGAGVFMDGVRVGNLMTVQQRRVAMQKGT